MSAGDLVNNLGKLEQKLKQVNFRNFRRSELLSGTLDIYVSIYGYVFSDFSRELSKLIASHGLELYGKTSKRFVDNLYLIVRDILHYKPPINKEMLLSNCGFVEMKMIMCTEILELVLVKCKEIISSENKRKIYRKPGYSSLSVPGNNVKNNNIKHVSVNKHANTTHTDSKKIEPLQHKISIQANEKKLKAATETENTDKTTKVKKSNHFFCHPSSNYSKLTEDQDSSEIPRHSKSNDCAIAKNPVSKCNVARSSYSKGKSVVLEKQEIPSQKFRIKVLKGPLQINDGFSGVPRIIPPEELSSSNDVSLYQNSIPSIKSSVIFSPTKPTGQGTITNNATVPVSVVNTTTTTIPKSRENAVITTSGSKDDILTYLTSSTRTIISHNKPRKVHRPATTDTMPKYTNTNITVLKRPLKDTAPAESNLMENTTVQNPPDANNQPKQINLLTSSVSTKVADLQNLKASHNERSQAENVLSQIKDLSQNLTGSAEMLQQMRERSHQWNMQNAFLNCSEQNKENNPTLNKETVLRMSGCKIKQDSIDLGKTKESENPTHQLDYWIAKMNLMECAVKSLESKFKSL